MDQIIFAVIKDGKVRNAVVGEALAIVQALLPDDEVIQVTPETGNAIIGGSFSNGKFIAPKPFESWALNENGEWQPPVSEPVLEPGFYAEWNEENLDWDILEIPTE